MPGTRFDYTFQIVDQAESNAFAAPGGFVYVSRGILAIANSEDEMANVLGHEIMHVSRRHTAKQLAKQRVPGLLSLPGRVVGRVVSRDLGRLINAPVDTFGAVALASHSRQHEMEADRQGQDLAARTGYDPAALAAVLGRMEEEAELQTGAKRRPSFFDTHPTTPTRVREIGKRAEKIGYVHRPGIAADRNQFLDRLNGLVVGEDPAQGIFVGQKFMHPDLEVFIEFPPGWRTMNSPSAAGAMSPGKDGLVFVGLQGEGTDPAKPAHEFAKSLHDEYKIEPSVSEPVKLGHWPAYHMALTESSGRAKVQMHFLWVACRGMIYQMIGLAQEHHREILRRTAFTFRPLTPEERGSIQEARLRIVKAREGEDLAGLSDRSGNLWDLTVTALMNGISLEGPLEPGQRIKVAVSKPYRGR
jgi:predicted Zn-dependent protease